MSTHAEAKYRVRELTSDDAEAYRRLRLQAVETRPSDYQTTPKSATTLPWELQISASQLYKVFGVFDGDGLQGILGFRQLSNPKVRHKGIVWGMYLREEARGTGMAEALMERVLAYAAERVDQVMLSVLATNERAQAFFRKMGFERYGMEPHAMKIEGVYYDEVYMQKFLH